MAELHGFLPEARRSEVARQLGVVAPAVVVVEQPAAISPTRPPAAAPRAAPAPAPPPAHSVPPQIATAPPPSLADVMAEQLAEQPAKPAPREAAPPPADDEAPLADAVPGGYDLRCKVPLPAELVGKVLGSSRSHINDLEIEGEVVIHNWSDWTGLDAREDMTHLWVEGALGEHEVQYAVRRLEDHIALIIERNFGVSSTQAVRQLLVLLG